MYRSMLVPLDGSQPGPHALPLARAIAHQTGATLHLVPEHVMTVPFSIDAILVFDAALDAHDRALEQAYLDNLAQGDDAGLAISGTHGGAGDRATRAGLAASVRLLGT